MCKYNNFVSLQSRGPHQPPQIIAPYQPPDVCAVDSEDDNDNDDNDDNVDDGDDDAESGVVQLICSTAAIIFLVSMTILTQ